MSKWLKSSLQHDFLRRYSRWSFRSTGRECICWAIAQKQLRLTVKMEEVGDFKWILMTRII